MATVHTLFDGDDACEVHAFDMARCSAPATGAAEQVEADRITLLVSDEVIRAIATEDLDEVLPQLSARELDVLVRVAHSLRHHKDPAVALANAVVEQLALQVDEPIPFRLTEETKS